MNKVSKLLTLLFITISCSQESNNVRGLISGMCTTQDEIVAIKINTNEIETTAVCTINIFTKRIDISSISSSTSVNVEVNELTYTSTQTYSVNDVIQVTLNLDENIVVTGTPRIELLPE